MFKNILVAVDLEDDTHIDDLLSVASGIANAQGAKLHLLHVIGAAPAVVSQFLPESYESMASEKIEKDLTALAARVDLAEGAAAVSVRFGDVYQKIWPTPPTSAPTSSSHPTSRMSVTICWEPPPPASSIMPPARCLSSGETKSRTDDHLDRRDPGRVGPRA